MESYNQKGESLMEETIEIYNGAEFHVISEEREIWATQKEMVKAFESSKSNISEHITAILQDGELREDEVVREIRTTASDGKTYTTKFYNLKMIIAVGYKVRTEKGVRFRQWATDILDRYAKNGFVVNPKMTADDMKRIFDLVVEHKRDLERQEQLLAEQRQTIRKIGEARDAQTVVSIKLQGELMRTKEVAERFAPIGSCPDGYYERRGCYCRKPKRRKVDVALARQLLLGIPQTKDGE